MKINIEFDDKSADLLKDGYYAKHNKRLDESSNIIKYSMIDEYILLGKKARSRQARKDFIKDWGSTILWVIVIACYILYSMYSSNVAKNNSSYSKPSNSTIVCSIATCNDGSCSNSTGRGTCSHHGGIKY